MCAPHFSARARTHWAQAAFAPAPVCASDRISFSQDLPFPSRKTAPPLPPSPNHSSFIAQDFYEDIFEEFAKYGELESLSVCDNLADHLVGNVYVKYREEEDAARALAAMQVGAEEAPLCMVTNGRLGGAHVKHCEEEDAARALAAMQVRGRGRLGRWRGRMCVKVGRAKRGVWGGAPNSKQGDPQNLEHLHDLTNPWNPAAPPEPPCDRPRAATTAAARWSPSSRP